MEQAVREAERHGKEAAQARDEASDAQKAARGLSLRLEALTAVKTGLEQQVLQLEEAAATAAKTHASSGGWLSRKPAHEPMPTPAPVGAAEATAVLEQLRARESIHGAEVVALSKKADDAVTDLLATQKDKAALVASLKDMTSAKEALTAGMNKAAADAEVARTRLAQEHHAIRVQLGAAVDAAEARAEAAEALSQKRGTEVEAVDVMLATTKTELRGATSALESLHTVKAGLEGLVVGLMADASAAKAGLEAEQIKATALETHLRSAAGAADAGSSNLATLLQLKLQLEGQIPALEAEVVRLVRELARVRAAQTETDAELREARATIASQREAAKAARAGSAKDATEKAATIASLEKALAALRVQCAALDSQLRTAATSAEAEATSLATLRAAKQEADGIVQALEDEVARVLGQLSLLAEEKAGTEGELRTTRSELLAARAQCAVQDSDAGTARKDRAAAETQHRTAVAALQSSLAATEASAAVLAASLKAEEQATAAALAQVQSLLSEKGDLEVQLASVEAELERILGDAAAVAQARFTAEQQAAEASARVAALTSTLAETDRQLGAAQQEVVDADYTTSSLRSMQTMLEARLEELEAAAEGRASAPPRAAATAAVGKPSSSWWAPASKK
jgi:chromosome segregation ATPase